MYVPWCKSVDFHPVLTIALSPLMQSRAFHLSCSTLTKTDIPTASILYNLSYNILSLSIAKYDQKNNWMFNYIQEIIVIRGRIVMTSIVINPTVIDPVMTD